MGVPASALHGLSSHLAALSAHHQHALQNRATLCGCSCTAAAHRRCAWATPASLTMECKAGPTWSMVSSHRVLGANGEGQAQAMPAPPLALAPPQPVGMPSHIGSSPVCLLNWHRLGLLWQPTNPLGGASPGKACLPCNGVQDVLHGLACMPMHAYCRWLFLPLPPHASACPRWPNGMPIAM